MKNRKSPTINFSESLMALDSMMKLSKVLTLFVVKMLIMITKKSVEVTMPSMTLTITLITYLFLLTSMNKSKQMTTDI